jgi:prepilin-type N-terminal cleavage/methylation domain-containing protein
VIRRRRRVRRTDDRGFTLLEVTVSVVLLGLASTLVMGGLFTVVHSSRVNTEQARLEAIVSSAADRLSAWSYTPCPPATGTGSYLDVIQPAATTVGWPASVVSIVSIEYWDPTASTWSDSNNATGSGCNPNVSATSPRTLQRVTVRVSTPSGSYSRDLEVVKNNVIPTAVAA